MATLDKPNKDSTTPFRVMPDQSTDYRIVVLGSAGVGKTNCVLRFVHGQFRENYVPTVEDTYRQVVSCNKQITTLQITDTTGAHQFPAMQRLSIQKGHAFILAYSITSKQTFEDLKPIYQQIREIKGEQLSETPILLMGCKFDDTTSREVAESLGKQLANHWSCAWIETSAKTNLNICEAFQELLKLDKKRQFNFNVDQDGHLIEDGGSTTSMSISSSPHGGKRLTVHGLNTNQFSNSNSSNLNENFGTNNSATKSPTSNSNVNKAGRTSINSNSSTPSQSSKKGHRTINDQQDLNRSKKTSSSDSSSARKCRVM